MADRIKKHRQRIVKHSLRNSTAGGFTLIEVSVVILVISILLYVFSSLLSNISILKSSEDEADLLRKNILFCNKTAILSNEVIYLELNLDDESYRSYRMEREEGVVTEEEIVQPRSLSSFHSIIAVSINGGSKVTEKMITIPFTPDGISQELAIYMGPEPEISYTILIHKYGSKAEIVKGESDVLLDNPDWEEKLEDL